MQATINNRAYSLISSLKTTEINTVKQYNPSALVLKDEKGNEIFKIDVVDSTKEASISKFGIVYNDTTADGNACLTTLFNDPYDRAKREEIVKDILVKTNLKAEALEKQIAAALKVITKQLELAKNAITVQG